MRIGFEYKCLFDILAVLLTFLQLEDVQYHIEKYFARFCNLLGPGNRRYIQTLTVLTRAFLRALLNEDTGYEGSCHDTEKDSGENGMPISSVAINDFLFSLNIDNINLVKLLQYIKESNIMHKVNPSSHFILLPGSILPCYFSVF